MSVRIIHQTGLAPDARRRSFDLAERLSIADIVARALPGAPEASLRQLRVTVARPGHVPQPVPREAWDRVFPRPGTIVVLRVVPGLGAAITQLALWLSSAGLSAGLINVIAAVAYVGAIAVIGALVNSLIPRPPDRNDREPENTFRIDAWRNRITPGEPVPMPLGEIRVAPVYAAQPYSEIVGDDQYVRALFCLGYGRLDISDVRIGETSIDDLVDAEIEIREGNAGDDPVTLVPKQVLEESIGTELRQPQPPVDAAGNETSGPKVAQPHVASTAQNCTRVSVILHWPRGLYALSKDGDPKPHDVNIRIRQRLPGGAWQTVLEETFVEAKLEPFFRQRSWDLPSRGRWEIEVTNMDETPTSTRRNNTVHLAALQSIRPEYPLNVSQPLALISARIRASYQLNGTIDELNAIVQRHVPVWTGSAWTTGLSRNPASIYIHALQGPHHPYPVEDEGIDWDAMADWYEFCTDKGLHYDADIRDRRPLGELLIEIAAAGRASPRHDGEVWTVVIDRPQAAIADQVTPREAWAFSSQRSYFRPPDGVRVRFYDRTNGYKQAERLIPWPGHEGEIDLIEEWPITGKTDPAELAREIYREMLVAIHRRDRFYAMQEGAVRTATRGDAVALSYDVLSQAHACARVNSVSGNLITLDEPVTMDADEGYVIRFQDYDADDTVGDSIQSTVMTVAGTTATLRVTGTNVPRAGAVVIFGPTATHHEVVRVLGVEGGTDFTSRLIMTNDAPQIDSLADAYTPPAWDPAVGEVIAITVVPEVPEFAGVATLAADGTYGEDARTVRVSLRMPLANTVEVASIELDHRLSSGGAFTTETLVGASGNIDLTYDIDDEIELIARAVTPGSTESADSATVTYTVGSDALVLPDGIDTESVSITGGLGVALITVAIGDPNTASVQVFRTPDGDALDTGSDTLGDPVIVPGGGTISVTDGDPTRADLLTAGDMSDAGAWTIGGGWAISGGQATHSAGSVSTLSQPLGLAAGVTYRGAVTVSGRTAGSITVQLAGGTAVPSSAIDADGQALFSLAAASGNDRIEIVATSDFDGAVTEILLFLETPASAPQGTFDYRFSAINDEDVATAPSAAVSVTII